MSGEGAVDGDRARVFISYARADRPRVQPIVEALTAEGYDVWWDSHIAGGAAFAREIESALNQARAVVVVWSAASVGSDWVRDEAALGRDRGRLAPVRIDHVSAPARVPAPAPTRRQALWMAGGAAVAVTAGGWWLLQRSAPARSVAVLPFANLSGEAADDVVADGLSQEVRSALARIPALLVTSRTSSDLFSGERQDVAAIAIRLGVAFLLEGTVRKGGDILRIDAQLVRGADGFDRWSQTFDRPADNLLALESDIAGQVAAALQAKLQAGEAVAPGGTRSADAYQAYLLARRTYDAGGDEASLREAATLYQQALALDPAYANAQAGLARTLMAIADQDVSGDQRRDLSDQGLAAAEAAVRLAPNSAEAQAALGFVRMGRLDVRGAGAPYERAGQLGAGDADRLEGYGGYETRLGRFELALPALRRAVLLDPLNPNAHLTLGDALFLARQPANAADPLRRALQLNAAMTFVHSRLGDCRLLAGDLPGALAQYRAEPAALFRLTGLAIALQRQGDAAGARAAMADLIAQTGDNGLYQQAQALAQWGQASPCLDALERGLALKDAGLTRLKVDPMLDPVRAQPRFVRLLSAVGFT